MQIITCRRKKRMRLAGDKAGGITESMNRVSLEDYTIKNSSARKWKHINDSTEDFSIGSYSIVVCKHDSQQAKQNEWIWKKFTRVSRRSKRSNWLYRTGTWSMPKISALDNIYASFRNPKFGTKELIVQMTRLLSNAVRLVFQ